MSPIENVILQVVNWFTQLPPSVQGKIREEVIKTIFGQSELVEVGKEVGKTAHESIQEIVRSLSGEPSLPPNPVNLGQLSEFEIRSIAEEIIKARMKSSHPTLLKIGRG